LGYGIDIAAEYVGVFGEVDGITSELSLFELNLT
jgi:hypothetical protein